jgi:hypothetical protein
MVVNTQLLSSSAKIKPRIATPRRPGAVFAVQLKDRIVNLRLAGIPSWSFPDIMKYTP